jgi:NADP-dependent 3-hydroxy acid dehydrogenase YdfG
MSKRLENKVAVITGGSSGIGLANAQQFIDEGAFVFITGRRQAELDDAVKQIGKNVIGVQGDVAELSDLDHLYSVVKKEKGALDIVFANAGFVSGTVGVVSGAGSTRWKNRSLMNPSLRHLAVK